MTLNPTSRRPSFSRQWFAVILPWLDVVVLIAWGSLLLRYWKTGQLGLLIHPDYFFLVVGGGIILLALGSLKAGSLILQHLGRRGSGPVVQHITLFPPGISASLLLITAILGFLISPRIFTSTTALERGVTDAITMTRAKPQPFRSSISPDKRSLIDWVRTLNVYPEPEEYQGDPVNLTGFVVHPPNLGEGYFLISRFVITCCAADAYPIGLPVKLPSGTNQAAYPADTWLDVQGQMGVETLNGKRQLTILAKSLKKVDPPTNPYDY